MQRRLARLPLPHPDDAADHTRYAWRTRSPAPRALAAHCTAVRFTVKPVGESDAGDRHVRFDEDASPPKI
jgi:hypothetical protein